MKSKIENGKSKIGGALLALAVSVVPAAQACVGCREPGSETITHESPTVMAGFAFSWSVLFMLAFALLVVGSMGAFIWHTCQRIEREQARS